MEKDSVILKVEGKVSVADFRTVVDAFSDLMMTLTAETNADAAVDWIVADLKGGSATLIYRGLYGNVEGEQTVGIVVGKYTELARDASEGRIDHFSDPVRQAMRQLSSVVNGKIPRLTMGTPDEPDAGRIEQPIEIVEAAPAGEGFPGPRPATRAAVKGRIMMLDQKRSLYFTLQEAYSYRYIRCYPGKDHRSHLAEYWDKKTWVIVEGTLTRFGNTPTIQHITDIVPLPDGAKGGWRSAVGAAPRGPESSDIDAAEAVRRVRDGQA